MTYQPADGAARANRIWQLPESYADLIERRKVLDVGVVAENATGLTICGAAVSVTDGMALAAIGTDTGGSCRIPAVMCGLVGFKPTASRVPMSGVLPLSLTLDSIGPLAPTVACCATVDAVLSGDGDGQPLPPRKQLICEVSFCASWL